jgi:hypothetical protein
VLELTLPFNDAIHVPVASDVVYALLEDVPDSLAHFPKLDELRRDPDGSYRWFMEKIGLGKFFVQVNYGVAYTHDAEGGRITWESPQGVGNAQVTGSWSLTEERGGTRMTLDNRLVVRFKGLPSLVRRVVEPFAIKENQGLISSYMQNLGRSLGGGDGRVRAKFRV